jgi:hypothetical protein
MLPPSCWSPAEERAPPFFGHFHFQRGIPYGVAHPVALSCPLICRPAPLWWSTGFLRAGRRVHPQLKVFPMQTSPKPAAPGEPIPRVLTGRMGSDSQRCLDVPWAMVECVAVLAPIAIQAGDTVRYARLMDAAEYALTEMTGAKVHVTELQRVTYQDVPSGKPA